MSVPFGFRMLTLMEAGEREEATREVAALIAAAREARVTEIKAGASGETAVAQARRLAAEKRVGMVVAGWPPDPVRLQETLRLVLEMNALGVVARRSTNVPPERLLAPTGGGPHTMHQMWIANALARAWGRPLRMARILLAREDGKGGEGLTDLQARLMGIADPVERVHAEDVPSGVRQLARPGDMIVLGAPNYWRVAHHFQGSIPDLVARELPNDLIMLLGRKPAHLDVRDVFWEETVLLGLRPSGKEEVIRLLVDHLARRGQIPASLCEEVVNRALERERLMSTAAGGEAAFPHAALPGFQGVIGCLGVCPKGVDFGGDEPQPTRFVFLLVTPNDFYDDYLTLMARIAQALMAPKTRAQMLRCREPAEVLDLLAADQG